MISAYRNNLENREFGKEAPQNDRSERAIIAEWQGASESEGFENQPTSPKPNSPSCFGIYLHVPFCTKKCPYCHFYVLPNKSSSHPLLSEGLRLEWEQKKGLIEGKTIASIYFGGGTPSLFAPEGVGQVLERIRSEARLAPDCEITLEANPEQSDPHFFASLLSIGINRLSFGVQSLDDSELSTLGRVHSAKQAKKALLAARKAGFANLSIDLLYDVPEQTPASWERTLEEVGELPIDHLSLYNLTIEPRTAFYKRRETLARPTDEMSLFFLERALAVLEGYGLKRYEISAFCRPGFASVHNTGYWLGRPFLGFGPSAFSDWEGSRFQNIPHLLRYKERLEQGLSPAEFSETLSPEAARRERLAVRLRLLEGVPECFFFPDLKPLYEKLAAQDLLTLDKGRVRLTDRGLLFYDMVAAEIV